VADVVDGAVVVLAPEEGHRVEPLQGLHLDCARRSSAIRQAALSRVVVTNSFQPGASMDSLTAFGAVAVTAMMVCYALEPRGRAFILAFAAGCMASSVYGFLAGTWPFGVVEVVWALVALRRWQRTPVRGSG
jgi:hypothetical protein